MRPYCHFRHGDEAVSERPPEPSSSTVVSYNPTPIALLSEQKNNEKSKKSSSKRSESSHKSSHKSSKSSHKSSSKSSSSGSSSNRDNRKAEKPEKAKKIRSESTEKPEKAKRIRPESIGEKAKRKRSESTEEKDNDVQSFLDAMLQLDKKNKATDDKKVTKAKERPSSSSIEQPKKVKVEEPKEPQRKRIQHQSSSTTVVQQPRVVKKTVATPAQAMMARFKASRDQAMEDRLQMLTEGTSRDDEGVGGGRKAHSASKSAVQKPIICDQNSSSKVPVNVRQRYLNSIVDECLKIHAGNPDKAYNRAVEEEKVCSDRSKNRNIYLNLVVNCIKKLRNEAKKADTNVVAGKKEVQPNLITTHLQVLAGKPGSIGHWSIEKPVKQQVDLNEGDVFYALLQKYILNKQQLVENGYPVADADGKVTLPGAENSGAPRKANERTCDRCSKTFFVDRYGDHVVQEECIYHWSRLRKMRGNRATGFLNTYPCCKGDAQSDGCQVHHCHVVAGVDNEGYVRILPSQEKEEQHQVFALDCEMCYTTKGIELTRITVIDKTGTVAYESFVKPTSQILDYNTRFSGVTAKDLENVTTNLRGVQAILLSMFSEDTILIGHSLESDLKALKLVHKTVVDTTAVFPHKYGLPYKRALRTLSGEYLQRIIQDDVSGHDPREDALAALDLMKYKVKEDLKHMKKVSKSQQ